MIILRKDEVINQDTHIEFMREEEMKEPKNIYAK